MKIVDPITHGIIDYSMAISFLIAPTILDFSGRSAMPSYALGIVYIGISLLTRYPLGIATAIPFPTHGRIETLIAAAFFAAPWLWDFWNEGAARNCFLAAGVALSTLIALSDYKGRRAMRGPHAAWTRSESYAWQSGSGYPPDDTGKADSGAPLRFN